LLSGAKEKYLCKALRKASAGAAEGIPPPPGIFPGKNLKGREITGFKVSRFHRFQG
jgi:hypothetical protein